ncbi:MAG: UDP-3-O-acyl-N-acetylglucosamine deacetylase [Elusimicrobia bacterium]|jgi:UDP-3-O-[3-hydroxymyristoyl] N-acetylglucosamine deacetylase/3-hydroxyacyl-[acyl-carrier-protein] dehydratase|nr:UDP-3-O-acyl-N-acetylglucosamine deacetylase [Elusimicrobiota bacterium]
MDARQHTIKKDVSIEGIGIHTGCSSKVTLKPAPADSGIKFKRVDIAGLPEVPAHIDFVTGVLRGTTVENGAAKVQTIEHLLAAAAGLEIDNLTVDINADELPVGDGSASIFTEALLKAGIKQQDKARKYYRPSKILSIKKGETEIMVLPEDEFSIGLTLHYNDNMVGSQFKDIYLNPQNYIDNISTARTYCFEEEIDKIKEMGLGLGGNTKNTIVIGSRSIKNTKLRFKDEFVRHKILDLLGDLYLLGRPLKARVIAIRCGHAANIEITKKLRDDMRATSGESKARIMDIDELMSILPHRYPFLMVDRIVMGKEKNKATGYKNITVDEPFFKGHYPERPVFPRALIIEFIAQSSAVMLLSRPEVKNKLAYFIIIQNVKFKGEVKPMDILRAEVELVRAREKGGKVRGEVFSGDKKVATAEFMFSLVKR